MRVKMAHAANGRGRSAGRARQAASPSSSKPVRAEFARPLAEPTAVHDPAGARMTMDEQRTLRLAGIRAARRRLVKLHRANDVSDELSCRLSLKGTQSSTKSAPMARKRRTRPTRVGPPARQAGSPRQIPRARAVRIRAPSRSTVRERPTTFSSGTSITWRFHHATMRSALPIPAQKIDRTNAQRRGEQAVLGRRHGAALDMAQHRGARLGVRLLAEPVRQPVADAVLRRIECIDGMAGGFRHHDQRRAAAGGAQARDMLDHAFEPPRHFRDQHDVGRARDARGDGDVARVAAHHLEHHDALVAGAGRMQAVERLGGDGDGRRIADGALGIGDVVVDGLGNADEGHGGARHQAAQDAVAAVAPDADQPDTLEACQPVDHLARGDPSRLRSSIGKAKGSPRIWCCRGRCHP